MPCPGIRLGYFGPWDALGGVGTSELNMFDARLATDTTSAGTPCIVRHCVIAVPNQNTCSFTPRRPKLTVVGDYSGNGASKG